MIIKVTKSPMRMQPRLHFTLREIRDFAKQEIESLTTLAIRVWVCWCQLVLLHVGLLFHLLAKCFMLFEEIVKNCNCEILCWS